MVAGGQRHQRPPHLLRLAAGVGPIEGPQHRSGSAGQRSLDHEPLQERGQARIEQLGVVLEDLAGPGEVILARLGDLGPVRLLGELGGQPIDQRVDEAGAPLARHGQCRLCSSMSLMNRSKR